MKARPLAYAFLLLLAVAVQLFAQKTNTTNTTKRELIDEEVGLVPASRNRTKTNIYDTTDPNELLPSESLVEAQRRYQEDARTNRITLDKPQYTNAPWSEIRLRAAALKGDGLAASLCSGSNASHQFFWLSLAATNGWIPSQVHLAKDNEYQRPKNTNTTYEVMQTWDELMHPELEEIVKQPKATRQTAAQFWWSKAKAGLPKLKDDAARDDARAIYALGLLHESGDLVESNAVLAAEMFHKAAESGLAPAQESLGSYCGWHLTNQVEAAAWYYRAATQGLMKAQLSFSMLHNEPSNWHFDEHFLPSASEKARWTFERASQPVASFNTYFACNELGELYLNGLGVQSNARPDPLGIEAKVQWNAVETVKWFRRAIDLGIPYGGGEYNLALCYFGGDGVPQDDAEGLKWIRKANEKGYEGDASWETKLAGNAFERGDYHTVLKYWRKNAALGLAWAQFNLGTAFRDGNGVTRNGFAAAQWFQKAAEQGRPDAQFSLGWMYSNGEGVPQDYAEALKWYRKAANQGDEAAQANLGVMYAAGYGVPQDYVEAYKWHNLAAAQGVRTAIQNRDELVRSMTPSQIAEGQRLSREFKPRQGSDSGNSTSSDNPTATGTGFFITDDGYLISNYHVVKEGVQVRLLTRTGKILAKVVSVDSANDLALLKADGRFASLPVAASRAVKLGGTVATVGFPNISLQGFAPKLTKGEISSLTGFVDDARYFQISVPVQPGNSGGALVDERGNVVGVVSAKLGARVALAASGALPENVNYAVKSSYLLSFLESVPEVAAKLKEPSAKDKKFEEVVKDAEQAAVLVLVY